MNLGLADISKQPLQLAVGPNSAVAARFAATSVARAATLCASAVLASLILLSYAWDAPGVVLSALPTASGGAIEQGDSLRQIMFVALFAIVAGAGVWYRGTAFLARIPPFLLPAVVWCWLSIAWAIAPDVAIRRVGLTTVVMLAVSYSVRLLDYRRVVNILLVCFAVILAADWLAIAFFPLSVHQGDEIDKLLVGTWRGIHKHKNEAGAFLAFCIILFVSEAARTRSIIGVLVAVAAAVFLAQARSKTAAGFAPVAIAIGLCAALSFHSIILRRLMFGCLLLGTAFALVFAENLSSQLLAVFEDPSSLTGRVQIWPVMMAFAADHPLLGSGYGSFWSIGDASPIFTYGRDWITTIDHSHNGYLELLVHTGALGLGLGVLTLVLIPLRALFTLPLDRNVSRTLLCALLTFGLLQNLLETSLLDRANGTWVVMLVAYTLLARAMTEQQGAAHAPAVAVRHDPAACVNSSSGAFGN